MTDKNEQRLQEEREDAALELLMKEYVQIEGAALWREFQAAEAAGNEPKAPQREDRNSCRGSRENNRRMDFLMRIGKRLKRAAVIFLVLICLLSPWVISVEAFKIPVINYFVTLKNTFSGFSFGENVSMNQKQEEIAKLVSSVPSPEGYLYQNHQTTSDGKLWFYYTYEGKIAMTISSYPSKGQINVDTEDVKQVSMKIHDYDAVYLQKEGHRLMWMDGKRELVVDVRAFELNEDEFWRYAYSLAEKMSQ